jgi:hypothetical protein
MHEFRGISRLCKLSYDKGGGVWMDGRKDNLTAITKFYTK